jgi:probable phosphoglycerate mutase
VYASPLDRAVQTAEAIGAAVRCEVRPDIRLHEWRHWAQWAGMTWEELRTKGRDAWNAYQSAPASVTSGESLAELGDRMESWLTDVRRDHDSGVVVGVSHLEPLRTIVLRLLGRSAAELHQLQIGLGQAVQLLPEPSADPLTGAQVSSRLVG